MLRPRPAPDATPHSSYGTAVRDPAAHRFVRGAGYFNVGRMQNRPEHTAPAYQCFAPGGTQDRTWHALQPPGGRPPINFRWHADSRQWFRRDGRAHRLGFNAEYLSRAGWTYLRATNGPHSI